MLFLCLAAAMLAFAVYEERIMLHFKIGVLAYAEQVINRLVFKLAHSSAFAAYHLRLNLLSRDQGVPGSRLAALPLDGMQDMRIDEEPKIIIDRSLRDMLRQTCLLQLLRRKGLR